MIPQSGWFHNNWERWHDWQVVNDKSVNAIPATATPVDYAFDGAYMTQYTLGPAYAGWLLKKSLPVLVPLSSGILTTAVDIWPSVDALSAQAWEFDDRFTDAAGDVYPCDSNFVLATGGVLQSVTASGAGWVDTAFKPGIPAAGQWITLTRTYAFNTKLKTCQMLSASLGSQSGNAGALAPVIPALLLTWAGNIIVKQNQVVESASGQTFGLTTRNNSVSATGNL